MMKMNKVDLERIKSMLTDAITVMCKSGLSYRAGFSVEGLLGITLLDDDQVFLVNIKETVQTETISLPRLGKHSHSYIQESHSSSETTEGSSDEADCSPGKPKRKRRKPQKIVQNIMSPSHDKHDDTIAILEAADINIKKEEPEGIPLGSDSLNWLGNIMALQQNPRLQSPVGNKYSPSSSSNLKHGQTSPLFSQGNLQFPNTTNQLFPPAGQTLPALSSILGGPGSSNRGGGGAGTILPDLSTQPEVAIVEEEMVKVTIPDFMGNPATEQHTVNACLRPNPGPGRVRLIESSPISVERDQLIEALRKATYKKEAGYYLMYRLLFLTVGKETLAYCNGPGKRHSDRPSLSDDLINTCKTYARAFCAALGRPVPPNVVLGRAFTVARQNASRPEWKTEDPPDHMMAWNRILQEASHQVPAATNANSAPPVSHSNTLPLASNANSHMKVDQQEASPSSQFFQQMTGMASLRPDMSVGRQDLSQMRSELPSLRTDNTLSQLFPPNLGLSPVKTNQN